MFSIYHQLSRRLFWVGTVAIGVAIGVFFMVARREFIESFNENLLTKAYAVSSLTDQEHGRVMFDFSEDFLNYFDNESPTTFFQIWDEGGKLVFESRRRGGTGLPQPVGGTASAPEFRDIYLPSRIHARVVSFCYTPRPEEGETQWDPNLVLRVSVAMDRAELDQFLSALLFVGLGCWGIFTGAILYFVRRTVRHGLRPLGDLGTQLSRLDASSLSAKLAVSEERRELVPIVQHLNALLGRLHASFERERRFNAAVAHELRTPLAELRSMAECAVKWPETREADFDRETLGIVLRMEAMLGRMLALSRGESGKLSPAVAAVDLPAAVAEVWGRFAEFAERKKISCHFDLEAGTAAADPVLLDSILENLTDNAIEHSPEGGSLSVAGRAEADGYALAFTNAAPELTPEDLAKMFDAFWRKDAARSGSRHSGLGLPLARTFARAMGWELSAELAEGRVVFKLNIGAHGASSPGL